MAATRQDRANVMQQRQTEHSNPVHATVSQTVRTRLRRWDAAARRFRGFPWVGDVLALFLASRLAFLVVTYVGYVLVQAPKYSSSSVGISNLVMSWNRWDAIRYLSIATLGYTSASQTAFFPLYPLLIRGIMTLVQTQSAYIVGLLISNLAFLGALLLLYALVEDKWGSGSALRAVVYLTIFPTALYTFAPYNESLYLLLSLACFFALQKQHWALAGISGGLAALTRSAGILLIIPFCWAWWNATFAPRFSKRLDGMLTTSGNRELSWTESGSSADVSKSTSTRHIADEIPAGGTAAKRGSGRDVATHLGIAWALAIPISVGLYAAYCGSRFGDPLAFAHAQSDWNRVLTWPWQSVAWQFRGLITAAPASFYQVHDLLDLTATLGFLVLLIAGWRRLPMAQTLYMAALMVLILIEPGGVHLHTNDPMTSNARFVLEMFPGFIVLGILTGDRPRWHQTIVMLFASLLACLTVIFVLGRWLV